jgi:hypothetical protein
LVCLLSPLALHHVVADAREAKNTSRSSEPGRAVRLRSEPNLISRRLRSSKPPQEPKANPFENVPAAVPAAPQAPAQQPPAQPGKPQLEAPKPTAPEAPAAAGNVIEALNSAGRRVPQIPSRAIATRKGDIYNEDLLHRDFMALWNTGRSMTLLLKPSKGKPGSYCASC